MSKSKEAALSNRIIKKLKAEYGCFATKIHGSAYQPNLPDIAVVLNGQSIWIETKLHGEVQTTLQREVMADLAKNGARTQVVYSVKDAIEFLELIISDNTVDKLR